MLIDCESCAMRDLACGDCVVTVLLGLPALQQHDSGDLSNPANGPAEAAPPAPATRVELDGPERAAIAVLAGQGLVPPLRLVPRDDRHRPGQGNDHRHDHSQDEPDMLPEARPEAG